MVYPEFSWLPEEPQFKERLRNAALLATADAWRELVALARTRLDFIATARLDRALKRWRSNADPQELGIPASRIAVLSSSTSDHLAPGLRIAGLRRGILVETYVPEYGQYRRELLDVSSGLKLFRPDSVVFAFDRRHLVGEVAGSPDAALAELTELWRATRDAFAAQIIQQTVLNTAVPVLGQNEHRLQHSPYDLVQGLNAALREATKPGGVDLLALDDFTQSDGLSAWHDPRLWHHGKQEITPQAAPMWGDLVMRLVAARLGRSAKCVVLDLDNTLWGGVIGDDGLEGIVLGQGSAAGEAYRDFQIWLRSLSQRGILLTVCSKNDEATAMAAFERHPEMVLRPSEIACFIANWKDKPTNLRRLSATLNIGADSLVFVDDNRFEREIVRRELPDISVPELPEDPSFFAATLARAGYFEGVRLTEEDFQRVTHYRANTSRQAALESATDMESFLASLDMELVWSPFDEMSIGRIAQLINKTNQFNLTTQRFTEPEVRGFLARSDTVTLYFRLKDRFGDNGIIGVIVARNTPAGTLAIESWLMSCRVLGRRIEEAMLNVLVESARQRRAHTLVGHYVPSPKNAMVKDHYAKLGFLPCDEDRWALRVSDFVEISTPIRIKRAEP